MVNAGAVTDLHAVADVSERADLDILTEASGGFNNGGRVNAGGHG